MQRKIFYTRRSKRPLFIMLALTGMCLAAFFAGIRAGSAYPGLFDIGPASSAARIAASDY